MVSPDCFAMRRAATSRVSRCVIKDVSVRLSSFAKRSASIRKSSGNRRENVFFAFIQASRALRLTSQRRNMRRVKCQGASNMTPSGWHDDAHGRDAGHDEMQSGVYRFLDQSEKQISVKDGGKLVNYDRKYIDFECPFYSDGRIITFVDVCLLFSKSDDKEQDWRDEIILCYEIKPKIYSVGAVVRQCHATAHAVRRGSIYSGYVRPGEKKPLVYVVAVVPHDDQKRDLLAEFWPKVLMWNAATKTCDWPRVG
jgi:hypothetical protein